MLKIPTCRANYRVKAKSQEDQKSASKRNQPSKEFWNG